MALPAPSIGETVSLKEHFEKLFEAMEKRHDADQEKSDIALKLAASELARRLDDLNGEAGRFREMQSNYMPRETAEAKYAEYEKRIAVLENAQSAEAGQNKQNAVNWDRVFAVAGFAIASAALLARLFIK